MPELENQKPPKLNEWSDLDSGEREILTKPIPINDPNCDHDWELVFVDNEGYNNYRCKKCPFGKRDLNG